MQIWSTSVTSSLEFWSLHKELYCLHCDIFIASILITTQPHLNVISGRRGELLYEPWRSVPGAPCVVLTTSFPIPQRIIWIEDVLEVIFTACVTEVVIPHKWRNCSKLSVACVCTRTYICPVGVILMKCCRICSMYLAWISDLRIVPHCFVN